jgi:signal transduction histidine kinase
LDRPKRHMVSSSQRFVSGCLIGLAIALLVVGVVSGTFTRHVVQIVPIIVAIGVLTRRPDWGAYAAVPIFLFWIFIVVLIWLFLLGLSRIANGHYTVIEILSTLFMVGFSVAGVVQSIPLGKATAHRARARGHVVRSPAGFGDVGQLPEADCESMSWSSALDVGRTSGQIGSLILSRV